MSKFEEKVSVTFPSSAAMDKFWEYGTYFMPDNKVVRDGLTFRLAFQPTKVTRQTARDNGGVWSDEVEAEA